MSIVLYNFFIGTRFYVICSAGKFYDEDFFISLAQYDFKYWEVLLKYFILFFTLVELLIILNKASILYKIWK